MPKDNRKGAIKAAFEAAESEIEYQNARWNEHTTSSGGIHTVGEYLVFLRSYLREAEDVLSRNPEPQASELTLHTVRKIAGLSISCMAQNGTPKRIIS